MRGPIITLWCWVEKWLWVEHRVLRTAGYRFWERRSLVREGRREVLCGGRARPLLLDELRNTFRRKSFVVRGEKLCRALLAEGRSSEELAQLRLGEVPPSGTFEKYLERRAELGLDVSPEAPLVVDPYGKKLPEEAVVQHLRFARTVRVSIEGNAHHCRGLLATRYGISEEEVKS